MVKTLYVLFILLSSLLNQACCKEEKTFWYPYQFDSGHHREELIITRIEAVDILKPNCNDTVVKWKSLSLQKLSYAIGITERGIVLVKASNENGKLQTDLTFNPLNNSILDADIFANYDKQLETFEIIVVASIYLNTATELVWFKVSDDLTLAKFWNWNTSKFIKIINYFNIDDVHHLLLVEDGETNFSVDVYDFNLVNMSFRVKQGILLKSNISSVALTNYNGNTYLSISQERQISVYKYDKTTFNQFKTIPLNYSTDLVSFKIGPNSYLAINGNDTSIYKFPNFERADTHLNVVDFWLPITTSKFGDEKILIAEQILNHGSHTSFNIEGFVNNGSHFELHEEMICAYHGEISNGLDCIVEAASTLGIKGSAAIYVEGIIGIIVPRKNLQSELFLLQTKIKEAENPIENKIKKMNLMRKNIEDRLKNQKLKYREISDSLKYVVKNDEENVISAPWKVDNLRAAAFTQNNLQVISRAKEIPPINLSNLKERVLKINEKLGLLKEKLLQMQTVPESYKHLIFKGPVEVLGVSSIRNTQTSNLNSESFNDVHSDIVTVNDLHGIPSQKKFRNINVEALNFKNINGIPAENLAFADIIPLKIDGDITFTEPVLVEGNIITEKVNGVDVKNSWVQVNRVYNDTLEFNDVNVLETLETDIANKFPIHKNYMGEINAENNNNIEEEIFENLFISGNITIETIHNENLNEIIQDLCMKNLNTFIPGQTTIEGEILIDNSTRTNYLNNLKFPENFVTAGSEGFSTISGLKVFKKVFVKELTTEALNNVDPDNIVTFSEDQDLPGKFIFDNLTVTESLEILGEVSGTHINELETNVPITESNTIKSNVNFKNLEVEGNIIILSTFNGSNLPEILDNIVYKFENPVQITSVKEFPYGFTSNKNIFLQSNTINNIPIDSFVNKQIDQNLAMHTLNGDVIFDNLFTTGNIGGINLTKLEMETVKLSGEQFISSRIIVEDQIYIRDLQILESLNDVRNEDYLYASSNNSLNLGSFDEILVENLTIRANLDGTLENFNLTDFVNSRMSYTLDQIIYDDYTIGNSKIQDFNTTLINNYQFNQIFDENVYSKKIFELLFSGKLKVEELLVTDSINITSVNGIPMQEILKNCLFSKEHLFKEEVSLMDVNFSDLHVESFNDVKFVDIVKNLVFKNESSSKVFGHKIYLNGFDVLNYIDTERLNGIRINKILRKNGVQTFESPLVIDGNVVMPKDIQVDAGFNGVSFEKVMDVFNIMDEDTYVIKDDVMFRRISYINELVIDNNVNDENLTSFLENIVDINDDSKVNAPIVFKEGVKINGNMVVYQKINDIDIESLKENIVLITQDGIIEGSVKFKNPVVVKDELTIDGDLVNQFVIGIDLNAWQTNATFIDRGLLKGTIIFEDATINEFLKTKYLNKLDTNLFIPLKTEQHIEKTLDFMNLSSFNDVGVNNLVNSHKLLPEYENTVMLNKMQEINSNVVFENNVLVENNLLLLGQINGYLFKNLVLTDRPFNLTAAYTFIDKVTIKGSLEVSGAINGVNMTEWLINGVVKENMFPQIITYPWIINENITFNNDVISGGNISGLETYLWTKDVKDKTMFLYSTEHGLKEQYLNICNDVKINTEIAKKNVYKFKYFEFYQFLDVAGIIETTFSFEHMENQYLIVSNKNSCVSTIFLWENNLFVPFLELPSGSVEQIVAVQINNFTFLVTRGMQNKNKCLVEGSNIWRFDFNDVSLLYKIEDSLLLQESKVPGTFYAMFPGFVVEYKIEAAPEPIVTQIRKWNVPTENSAFIPHGLNIGLALRNGKKIFYLKRSNPEDNATFGYDYSTLVTENFTETQSFYLPGYSNGEVTLLNVGQPRRKNLVAVTFNEITTIPNSLDIIKIYEDAIHGKIFHKVPSHKPSSILSLEFGENGETLLVFTENKSMLQVYEYRGVEGFKHRNSAYLQAQKLISLKLPLEGYKSRRNFIGVINKNRLAIIQAIMDGEEQSNIKNLKCTL